VASVTALLSAAVSRAKSFAASRSPVALTFPSASTSASDASEFVTVMMVDAFTRSPASTAARACPLKAE